MPIKVTMNLSERDVENTDSIVELTHSRTKAQALSTALSLTKAIASRLKSGGEIFIKGKDGHVEKLLIPDFE